MTASDERGAASEARRRRALELVIGLVCFYGYSVTSFHVIESFPFSPLSMFSGGLHESSRILARTADGEVHELGALARVRCERAVDFAPEALPACSRRVRHSENDRLAAELLRSRSVERSDEAGGASIDVVRRIFRLPDPRGAPVVEDCVLLRCSADVAGAR